MPKLGFDMAEGTLVRWVRGLGETVQKGEVLAEIETDKATVGVEAVESGVVRKHLVQEGVAVPIGTPIAIIGTADEPIDDVAGPSPTPSRPAVASEPASSAPASPRPVQAARTPPARPPGSPQAAPGLLPRPEKDEFISPSRLRQAISRRMTASKQQVPHFYLTADLD